MVTGLRHGLRLVVTTAGLVLAMTGVVAMVTPGPGAPPRPVAPIELAAPEPSHTPGLPPTEREETVASSAATPTTVVEEVTDRPRPQVVAATGPEAHPPAPTPTPTIEPVGRAPTSQVPAPPAVTDRQGGSERHVAATTPTERPSRPPSEPDPDPGPGPTTDTQPPSGTETPSERPRDARPGRSSRGADRAAEVGRADRGASATRPPAAAHGGRHGH